MQKFIIESKLPPDILGGSHRYRTDKGQISLIHPCRATSDTYEIYCIEGNLLKDVERFLTLEKAEKRIRKLLK